MRYSGRNLEMSKSSGFSLIELLIVVAIIAVISAIAIPNLMASRRSANEASAIAALRTIHGAQFTYATTYGSGNYAGTVAGLDGVGLTVLANLGLVDNVLGSGTKSGYAYTTGTNNLTASRNASFCTRAIPTVNSGVTMTGSRCFGVATDGAIMTNSAASTANCGCSIDAAGYEFVDRSSPLAD